jgi:MYXO-CTERM domain-containing protein
MIRGNRKFTTANIAIATALLCGTPAVFAQETAAVPEVQTVAPPPVVEAPPAATPTVAPPPMVPTISQSPEAPVAPREPAKQRAAPKPAAKAVVRAAPAASPVAATPVNEPEVINAPVLGETSTVTATVEDTAPVAPVEQSVATPIADGPGEDWMIYGGLAAALGLAGLGGVLASRRRRGRVSDEPATLAPNRAVAAPNPRPLPVQQSAAPIERFTPLAAAPVARPSFADQHLPPVTDPLFAHRPVLGPITDPLFMHETIMPPVTDPMFAGTDEYVGSSSAGAAFDKRRDWQPAPGEERKPLHEFEPAE